jgi:hypothetical protein
MKSTLFNVTLNKTVRLRHGDIAGVEIHRCYRHRKDEAGVSNIYRVVDLDGSNPGNEEPRYVCHLRPNDCVITLWYCTGVGYKIRLCVINAIEADVDDVNDGGTLTKIKDRGGLAQVEVLLHFDTSVNPNKKPEYGSFEKTFAMWEIQDMIVEAKLALDLLED